jgi:hypothetical protein
MHQTTVRFGEELWEALEEECLRLGLSVAQYLREAAMTRLVYAAGRRGDDEFEFALQLATGKLSSDQPPESDQLESLAGTAQRALTPQERALREATESAALAAEGRLARQRARELRELIARRRAG